LGTVGLEWQLGGFAADPPTGSMGFLTTPQHARESRAKEASRNA